MDEEPETEHFDTTSELIRNVPRGHVHEIL